MDIEKLVENLKKTCWGESAHLVDKERFDAANAISMLQEENEDLRADLSQARESLDFARTKDAEILWLGMELGHLKKHMERLTHRLGNGEIVCNMARDDCRKMGGDCQIDSKILERLAAYEETGLEPEDFKRAFTEDALLKLTGQLLGVTPDRLRELIQADNEGRCVVMPCQPGYKISYISSVGLQCNAVIKDYTPENIFITAETEISNAKPLSHTFSILEIEAALRREKE